MGQGRDPGPKHDAVFEMGERGPSLPPGPSSRILKQKKTSETGSVASIQVTDEDTETQNE